MREINAVSESDVSLDNLVHNESLLILSVQLTGGLHLPSS